MRQLTQWVVGVALMMPAAAFAADTPKTPTFTKDIAPIFQDKCEACHRPDSMAPMSLTLRLEDELDVSRGETICRPEEAPTVARELEADVCWMAEQPLRPGGRYVVKHTTRSATAAGAELTADGSMIPGFCGASSSCFTSHAVRSGAAANVALARIHRARFNVFSI